MKFLDELRSEPILLAHHPLCGRFDDHLLIVRGRRVCRGCVTVYPTALLVWLALFLVRPDFWTALIVALALFGVQLLRFLSNGQGASIAFNIMLGTSLAFIIYSAIVCPADLRIYLYPFIVAVIVSFEFLKGRKVFTRCKSCPDYGSFPKCATGPSVKKNENKE